MEEDKGTHGEDGEDYKYRRMLVAVADLLEKKHVENVAVLAGLTAGEQDEISQKQSGWSLQLLKKLEQRGQLRSDDVSPLAEHLRVIQHEAALKVVQEYSTELVEEILSEPESDHSDESEYQVNTFDEFLVDIHLEDKFPQKLTLKCFQIVKDKIDPQKWVESFWQRLTSLDYRAGYPQHYMSRAFSMRDFIFGVLHCADDFLRQDILEKMSACQLAVPMILQGVHSKPPEFMLWALRRIMKKWKGKQDTCALEQPIVTYPVFIVSVLRIGDVRISKSQLLNTMLSYSQGNTPHGYFLSMEKDFVKPIFSVGSIECAWFLPLRDNENEIFPEITTFLNLRGDCRSHPKQTKFACRAADLTITLIATGKRNENAAHISNIRKLSKKTLFVCVREEDKPSSRPQKVHKPDIVKDWLFVKVLQVDVLSREICQQIAMSENNPKKCRSLGSLTQFCGEEIDIDENKPSCQEAKKQVQELLRPFETKTVLELKEKCFPLQNILHDWVQIDKERFDSTNEQTESFEHQRQNMRARKKQKREKQLQMGFSETIKSYHDIINEHKTNPKSLQYIFAFLQEKIYQIVNDNTQKDTSRLSELEDEIRMHVKYMKGSNGQTRMDKATELSYQRVVVEYNSLHKSCQLKNLGCEHFLRELGQLFEAFEEIKSLTPKDNSIDTVDITLLPSLAARLVAELHSFELMDGDTGSVPLVWITHVLDNLTRQLGDPKILVISVIGAQSSGKSTLLNSMFGLRFPVRAGRCTRGLFFRLLKLDETLANELEFRYLVVVDTEGIRSIDHDDRRFDNELVTLALSIANITVFNIEGENISPDMTGILQIAAHALMRMKEVDLECHCRIVQQRVSDLTAAERNKANTNRIMETLDEATKLAAEEEGLQGRYKKFSDVVDLQVDESLQYIPCLWTGGMSPPNHLYSDTVSKLKAKLIQDIREGKVVPDLTLAHFTDRVRDVWRAVKEENFVFNFQDSVRAVAYNKFCLEYNRWIVEMRQCMMIVTTHAYQILGSGVYERFPHIRSLLEPGDLTTDQVHRSNKPDIDILKERIRTTAAKEKEKLLARMEAYIARHPHKQCMFAYKKGFNEDAKLVIREVENQALAIVNDEYELLQVRSDLPAFRRRWRYKLTLEAKKKANEFQNSNVGHITPTCFADIWNNWMEIINDDMNQTKAKSPITSLKTVCEKLLLRVTSDLAIGSEVRSLMEKEGGINNHDDLSGCAKYIHHKFVKAWLMQTGKHGCTGTPEQQILRECAVMTQFVQQIVQKNLRKMLESDTGRAFDENGYQLMLRATLGDLTADKRRYKLPSTLIAKSLLHLSCIAFQSLVQYQGEHKYKCAFWLEKEKQMLFEDIQSFLSNEQGNVDSRCVEFLCYFMLPLYAKRFRNKFAKYLQDTHPYFDRSTRAVGLGYTSVPRYEQSESWPWEFLRHFAEGKTADLTDNLYECRRDFEYSQLKREDQTHDRHMKMKRDLIEETLRNFEQTGRESLTDVHLQTWLDSLAVDSPFLQNVGELFNSPSCHTIKRHMKQAMMFKLDVTASELERSYSDFYPYSHIMHSDMRYMRGCSLYCCEICPRCGVPCNKIAGHHDEHFAFLHRPRGFAGERYGENEHLVIEDCTVDARRSSFHRESAMSYSPAVASSRWRITYSHDNPGMKFWHWVMAQHNDVLASRFHCQGADIPSDWYSITKEEALHSLSIDEQMKLRGRFATVSTLE